MTPPKFPNPLSHIDKEGRLKMVDITEKPINTRIAKAYACLHLSPKTLPIIIKEGAPKGTLHDIIKTAELAGIMAGKSTSSLIPLCHPLPLNALGIEIKIDKEKSCFHITSHVKTKGRTGVEMEALCAASIASLTLYDMLKAIDKNMRIDALEVLEKTGGLSDDYGKNTKPK